MPSLIVGCAIFEIVSKAIGAEEEVPAPPLEELVGLIGGDPVPVDQFAGKGPPISEPRAAASTQTLQLGGRQELVSPEERQQLCESWGGHG